MIKLKFKDDEIGHDYCDDVNRIVAVFAYKGYTITKKQAYEAWIKYSDTMCAGWMCMRNYSNIDIYACVSDYFVEDKDG